MKDNSLARMFCDEHFLYLKIRQYDNLYSITYSTDMTNRSHTYYFQIDLVLEVI